MRTEHPITERPRARGATLLATALTIALLAPAPPAGAQAGSQPAAPGPGTPPGATAPLLFPAPETTPAPGTPAAPGPGAGQGFHSPQSAFAPLRELPGVLPWRVFGEVTHRQEGKRSVPVFPAQLTSLAGTRVKVQGFMLPLQPGERQKHFLLSAVPTTCNFCLPAGPEGIIEVRIRGTGIKVDVDAMVLEGTLQVLPADPMGLLYRLTDARAAR
jgi:hypothetical protein